MIGKFWTWFLSASLWIVSFGLMAASSGIDGAYLEKLMPAGWGILGQVLNTMSDVASEIIMYWFGRLQMDASQAKRKRAKWLLLAEFVLVGFSWLFGWRQLLPILSQLEGKDAQWLAPLMAAFTPAALISIGYAQALLAGKIEKSETSTKAAPIAAKPAKPAPVRRATIDEWREIAANLNGSRAKLNAKAVNVLLKENGFAEIPPSSARYWAKDAKEGAK
jgi:hypothetical protein